VLFLNELKFRTNTALNLRISLTSNNMPAVKAVLGQQGIVDAGIIAGRRRWRPCVPFRIRRGFWWRA